MKKPFKNVLLTIGLFFVVLGVCFGYAVFIRFKRAKMASQCAILSAAISKGAAGANDASIPFELYEFLANYEGGDLFRRDRTGNPLDSWDHPLVIGQTEHGGRITTRVTSIGRDGKLGTADDHFREFTFGRMKADQP